MRALVTGASGFIGSALCNALLDSGYDVIGVIRKNGNTPSITSNGSGTYRSIECNLDDYDNLAAMVDCKIDYFYHFAWQGVSGAEISNPEIQVSNILYTCKAAEAAIKLRASRFIFAASLITFETNYAIAHHKKLSPNSVYGSSKLAAAQISQSLCQQNGINYCEAVISNVYGAGETSLRLINSSIRKLLSGKHCSFTEGTQDYDFIYISDAAKGLVAIGECGKEGTSYYLGNGLIQPLKIYLSLMRDEVAPDAELGFGEIPAKDFSLDYTQFDLHELENDTGFKPSITFSEGIRKTRDWIIENG